VKLTVIDLLFSGEEGVDAGPLEEFCPVHEVRGCFEFFFDGGCSPLAMALGYEEVVDGGASGRSLRSERDFKLELAAVVTILGAASVS
jgi:hypothetical protein